MPEKASFNQNTCHGDELSMKASLVEVNASHLMDELFAEFEQDLDEFSLPAPVGLSPSTWEDTSGTLSVEYYPVEAVNTGRGLGPGATRQAAQPQLSPLPLNGLLLPGIATAAVALLLWIGSQFQQPRAITPLAAPLADSSDSASNRAFAAYMQRSLERINRNIQTQVAPAAAPAPQTVNLPALSSPVLANPKPSPKVVTVTERVYIPYQPPQPQPVIKPQQPLTAKRELPSPATVTAATKAMPAATQTLVGILELGDRSAALVGTDGITRQVHVGETLGPGGWSLVKVANQKAIIQRQGELRSIYVGQKF